MKTSASLRQAAARSASIEPVAGDDDTPQRHRDPPAPACPRCNAIMTWYNSRLQRQNGSQKIVHSFHCLSCGMSKETDEPKKHGLRVV
jgi:hypothetical protein